MATTPGTGRTCLEKNGNFLVPKILIPRKVYCTRYPYLSVLSVVVLVCKNICIVYKLQFDLDLLYVLYVCIIHYRVQYSTAQKYADRPGYSATVQY